MEIRPKVLILVSTGHFEALIRKCDELRDTYDLFGQIGSTKYEPRFPFARTVSPDELDALIKKHDLIVTHAGTGMLSRVHQAGVKAVVVPKQKRYGESNDGQVELAAKWGALGLAELCLDVNDLPGCIDRELKRSERSRLEFPRLSTHLNQIL